MTLSPILTRRKWKLKAHDQQMIFVNGVRERFVHPLMKAFIWALYLPDYPDMDVEIRIGDRYKPDVVGWQRDDVRFRENEPAFWGEAGQVGRDKIIALVKRYPDTHFCIGKYNQRLAPVAEIVKMALDGVKRSAPFDLISFPEDCARFVDEDGNITLNWDDVIWQRL